MGALKSIARREVTTSEPVTRGSRPHSTAASTTGFVLADLDFHLVYANRAGLQILSYPRDLRGASPIPIVQKRMQSIFAVERFTAHLQMTRFVSGRRRYVCRPFLVESPERPPMAAMVLERHNGDLVSLGDAGQRFRLSQRECETVQHLVMGLTTKEVAKRMGVSPNTIKQFVRLVMSKMGVTTRSGIVGKLIDH